MMVLAAVAEIQRPDGEALVGTTWDGLPIAAEWPHGASIVVRRADGDVLLLHRAHEGPDYDGPWGWTTPSGSRLPGEAILPAAVRELAEEADLVGIELAPIDLTGSWALFTAQVGSDVRVRLADVEHDRFEWVPPADAYIRVKPRVIADGIRRALAVPLDRLTFAPLSRDDLPKMVAWQDAGHVRRWWTDAVTDVGAAEKKYGPRIDGQSPTTVDVIRVSGRPIGFVQSTPLADDEEYFDTAHFATDGGMHTIAIDYAIGDPALISRGIGTRMLWSYIRDAVLPRFPQTQFVVTDPHAANTASIRACEKAGFRRAFDFDAHLDGARKALCIFDRNRVIGTLAA